MAKLEEVRVDQNKVERALLIGINDANEGLLDELEELVKNLDIGVIEKVSIKLREPSAHYLIGKGKFLEIAELAKTLEADCIILDDELSPAQQRNWEKDTNISVINRQEIILDIFAQRAQTKEARLQVELAKLEYSLPRLRKAWSHLSRQRGGGVTQRGEGESQLELDHRIVSEQIIKLKKDLIQVSKMREVQRKRRMRIPVPSAAVVGYTNAGKSSLINKLANSNLLAEDKLFATLDPSTRKLILPNTMSILLTDTVGFVRKLPHRFVEAFKSTLEEAVVSDFLIHVVDASNPDAHAHIQTTRQVLNELGAQDKKIILVFNKMDLNPDKLDILDLKNRYKNAIFISAKTKENFDKLLEEIEAMIAHLNTILTLLIPHDRYKEIAQLYKTSSIISKKILDEGVLITANIPFRLLQNFKKFEYSESF